MTTLTLENVDFAIAFAAFLGLGPDQDTQKTSEQNNMLSTNLEKAKVV